MRKLKSISIGRWKYIHKKGSKFKTSSMFFSAERSFVIILSSKVWFNYLFVLSVTFVITVYCACLSVYSFGGSWRHGSSRSGLNFLTPRRLGSVSAFSPYTNLTCFHILVYLYNSISLMYRKHLKILTLLDRLVLFKNINIGCG